MSDHRINRVELEAKSVGFGSQLDEKMFFTWLDSIDCVVDYAGKGKSLFIWIDGVDDEGIRDLVALFDRYDIAMRQLATLLTDQNKVWFANRDAWWFDEIFGH